MKIKRRYLGEIVRLENDRAICDVFMRAFSGYGSYFVYNSFGSEARTDLITDGLSAAGKRLYFPRVSGGEMCAVPYTAGSAMTRSAYGADEPQGEPFCGGIEVCVAPLLAINSRGYRIGYGGGYYDRFLAGRDILKIGVGYDFQIAEFEEEGTDVPMDYFISERGIYNFGGKEI